MFVSLATKPQEQHLLSPHKLFELLSPFSLYKVVFWDCQGQTHVFLVFPTQSGVKQHEGLAENILAGKGGK